VSGDLHVVHVRVVDSATGQPTPVRMSFQGQDGRKFAPLGRLKEFPTGIGEDVGLQVQVGSAAFHYVDGACEILLPSDSFDIEISKGPEYEPIRRTVTLGPGKMALRFVIERRSDLRKAGWFAGDCRAHELSPHAALVEGAAEGLAVVNLLARQRPSRFGNELLAQPQLDAFSGQAACLGSAECLVYANTYNEHPALGKLALLNCHRPVFPLHAGEEGFEDWTLADWCGQCHRKKGLVVWSEPGFWSRAFGDCPAAEGLALLIMGGVDAVEIAGPIAQLGSDPWTNWYALLNAGFRTPLAGSSGKCSNGQQLGACRTLAFVDPDVPFSYGAWIEAVRAGKTIVTDGPILNFSVEGHVAGTVIASETQGAKSKVDVALPFGGPGGTLELVGNGEVVAGTRIQEGGCAALTVEIPQEEFRWLAARYRTDQASFIAHTSPVYLANPVVRNDPAEPLRLLEDALLRGAQWARTAPFRLERNRTALLDSFRLAKERLVTIKIRAGGQS
jgi:hypothetical protein